MASLHPQRCRFKEYAPAACMSTIIISTIIFKLHHGLFTLTHGYCVTYPFYIDSDTWKKSFPSCLFWRITPCLWAGLHTPIGHHRGTIRWVEQRSSHAIGPCWTVAWGCYMHGSVLEICIPCSKFTLRTLNPRDSGMKHRTATRAISVHGGTRGKLLAAMVAADPWPYTVGYDKDAF